MTPPAAVSEAWRGNLSENVQNQPGDICHRCAVGKCKRFETFRTGRQGPPPSPGGTGWGVKVSRDVPAGGGAPGARAASAARRRGARSLAARRGGGGPHPAPAAPRPPPTAAAAQPASCRGTPPRDPAYSPVASGGSRSARRGGRGGGGRARGGTYRTSRSAEGFTSIGCQRPNTAQACLLILIMLAHARGRACASMCKGRR
jgi:hypothetical protein